MLILKTLNSTTKACAPFSFFSGEIKTLMVQVWDTATEKAATVTASLTTKTLTLPSSGLTDIAITDSSVTQDSTTSSIFSVTLTAAQTALMETGNARLSWTVGVSPNDTKYQAVGQLIIKKNTSVV